MHDLLLPENYFHIFPTIFEWMKVTSQLLFSILLFLSNFVYFFVVLFQKNLSLFVFFKNILIDIALIFFSCLMIVTMFISTIGSGFSYYNKNESLLLDQIKDKMQECYEQNLQINEELELINKKTLELNQAIQHYHDLLPATDKTNDGIVAESSLARHLVSLEQLKKDHPQYVKITKNDFIKNKSKVLDMLKTYQKENAQHHEKLKDKAFKFFEEIESLKLEVEPRIETLLEYEKCRNGFV